ncbi:MAG: hypothetical protein CR997_06680 [Acidobacteria bacterium]|nr:MAG: hypothetical protein CR997_06680 [Acidobacteriota bacterium]
MIVESGLSCGFCKKTLPPVDSEGNREIQSCPHCGSFYRVDVFPAFIGSPEEDDEQRDLSRIDDSHKQGMGKASCYFHVNNRAVTPCSHCGRFLCSLCRIPVGNELICPKCIGEGVDGLNSNNSCIQYDSIALWLAILPVLFFLWPALIGAPASLFITVRYFNKPCSYLPRTKARFILAALLSAVELTFILLIVFAIVGGMV